MLGLSVGAILGQDWPISSWELMLICHPADGSMRIELRLGSLCDESQNGGEKASYY